MSERLARPARAVRIAMRAARSPESALPVLIGLGILNHVVLTGSRVTVSLYALSLGASTFVVGALMGLYAFLPMWLAIAAGRLSDRVGVVRPMMWGSVGLFTGAALPFLVSGIAPLYVATSLLGVSFMLFQVSAQNATGGLGGPERRARNYSLLALGYSISGFAGPLIAGILIDHASYATTFVVLACLPLMPIAVFSRNVVALPAPVRRHDERRTGSALDLFLHPRLKRVFILNALLSMAWDLHTFFIPLYGAKLGLSASSIGVVLAAFAAATFTVRLAMPALARRLSELQVLTAALFGAAIAYCLFPFAHTFAPLLGVSFLLGLALGSGQPMVMSLLHAMTPSGRMGEAAGVRMSIVNTSTFAVPLVFGAVGGTLGLAPVFWSVGAALAGGGWFARKR